jgi:hypothetical protein
VTILQSVFPPNSEEIHKMAAVFCHPITNGNWGRAKTLRNHRLLHRQFCSALSRRGWPWRGDGCGARAFAAHVAAQVAVTRAAEQGCGGRASILNMLMDEVSETSPRIALVPGGRPDSARVGFDPIRPGLVTRWRASHSRHQPPTRPERCRDNFRGLSFPAMKLGSVSLNST